MTLTRGHLTNAMVTSSSTWHLSKKGPAEGISPSCLFMASIHNLWGIYIYTSEIKIHLDANMCMQNQVVNSVFD